jgi:hypothetical protein
MGEWEWVPMDSLKFHSGPPYSTLLRPVALWPFHGGPTCRAGGLRPSSIPLDTPRRTPMSTPCLLPTISWLLARIRLKLCQCIFLCLCFCLCQCILAPLLLVFIPLGDGHGLCHLPICMEMNGHPPLSQLLWRRTTSHLPTSFPNAFSVYNPV